MADQADAADLARFLDEVLTQWRSWRDETAAAGAAHALHELDNALAQLSCAWVDAADDGARDYLRELAVLRAENARLRAEQRVWLRSPVLHDHEAEAAVDELVDRPSPQTARTGQLAVAALRWQRDQARWLARRLHRGLPAGEAAGWDWLTVEADDSEAPARPPSPGAER